ncbi:MAG: hypothetical protein K2W95_07885 [Candidatus Obscuribacterales bacterium]|nr:hypothetical protein [Candidatus Obscuribacterales bacterium]
MTTAKLAKLLSVAFCMLSLSSLIPAEAQNYRQRVNNRQNRQQTRLNHGKNNGELTKAECARLQTRQTSLALREARFRKSGNGLSPAEAARLEKQQDNISKHIYRQKHDGQDRN